MRVKAYELWEDFYSNRPEHIKVVLRGEDDDSIEIYIPSGKKCIEAVNRFLAINFDYQVDPDANETDAQAVDEMLQFIFKKQDIVKKFNQMKRYMLIKGDALLHIRALPWERKGYKVCVEELKPEHYFPIEDFVSGATVGCHIVDVIRNPKEQPQDSQCLRRVDGAPTDVSGAPCGKTTTATGFPQAASRLSLASGGSASGTTATLRTSPSSSKSCIDEFELDKLDHEYPCVPLG
jgi:hypothetical protein